MFSNDIILFTKDHIAFKNTIGELRALSLNMTNYKLEPVAKKSYKYLIKKYELDQYKEDDISFYKIIGCKSLK